MPLLTNSELKLFYERLSAHYTQAQLSHLGLLDRTIDRKVIRALAEIDFEWFKNYYLPHHFTIEESHVHHTLNQDLQELLDDVPGRPANLAEVVFRGGGKSTTCNRAFPLWCICFSKRHFIVICSDSEDQAKSHLSTIKTELAENERIVADFGNLQGARWAENVIETNNEIRVVALGSGNKVRGRIYGPWRPDLIILDDIENSRDVMSEAMRRRLRRWLFGDVLFAGQADTRLLIIGNYLHYDCILRRCVENPSFYCPQVFKAVEEWAVDCPPDVNSWQGHWRVFRDLYIDLSDPNRIQTAREYYLDHEKEMVEGSVSAWPARWPYVALMERLLSSDDRTNFFIEMQNEVRDPGKQFFHYGTFKRLPKEINGKYEEWLIPWDPEANDGEGAPSGLTPWPLKACRLFGATDPAMGQSKRSDFAPVLIGAMAPDGRLFVIEADITIRTPDQTIEAQNAYLRQYPIRLWGIESVQFQAWFRQKAAEASMTAGVFGQFIGIPALGNKDMRIKSLQSDLENRYILVMDDGQWELKKELENYPAGERIDGLDCLEMLRQVSRQGQETENPSALSSTMTNFIPEELDTGMDIEKARRMYAMILDEPKKREEIPEEVFPFVFF